MPWKVIWRDEFGEADPLAQYRGERWFRKFDRLREKALTLLAEKTGDGAAFVTIGRDWESLVEVQEGSQTRWTLEKWVEPKRPIGFDAEERSTPLRRKKERAKPKKGK